MLRVQEGQYGRISSLLNTEYLRYDYIYKLLVDGQDQLPEEERLRNICLFAQSMKLRMERKLNKDPVDQVGNHERPRWTALHKILGRQAAMLYITSCTPST